jgi:hypothetical protein
MGGGVGKEGAVAGLDRNNMCDSFDLVFYGLQKEEPKV